MRRIFDRGRTALERDLRALAASPRPEFVEELRGRLEQRAGRAPAWARSVVPERRVRLGFAGAATIVVLAAAFAMGAPGYIKSAAAAAAKTAQTAVSQSVSGGGTSISWAGLGSDNLSGGTCASPTQTADDLSAANGWVGYLFVLNGVSLSSGWTITAHFSGGYTATSGVTQAQSQNVHFAVYAPAGAQLLDATATNPDSSSTNNFPLSHCGGAGSTSGGSGGGGGGGSGGGSGSGGGGGGDTGQHGQECQPGYHDVDNPDGSYSCEHNGDGGGNCGDNQGVGSGGNDNGFGHKSGCDGSGAGQYGHGVPICHRTDSKSNPWVLIVVDESALPAHAAQGDIIPAPAGGCPGRDNKNAKNVVLNVTPDQRNVGFGGDDGFTVTVTSGDDKNPPSGVISCEDNGATFDSAQLSSGVAHCAQTFSTSGDHTITVVYVPFDQAKWRSSTDQNTTVSVGKRTSTTTVTTSSPSADEGSSVTFTATVSGAGSTPSGTVRFYDGSNQLSGDVALSGSGTATFSTSSLSTGGHSVSAVYSGDSGYDGSTGTATETINKVVKPTTTSLVSSANPSAAGQSVTFTATVSGSGGTPSGKLNLSVDGAQVASVNLDSNGRAAVTVVSLAAGSHTVAASFSPADGTPWVASNVSLSQTVNKVASATTLGVSDSKPAVGQSVALTATVKAGSAAVTSGTVIFKVNGVTKATVNVNGSGVASASLSFSSTGQSTVEADYNGTTAYATSSDTTSVNVKKK